jgi:hypothetical protein
MKLSMSECPYCKDKRSVMPDVNRLRVSFESPLDRGKACPHLALACLALTAGSQGRRKQQAPVGSRVWFWRSGQGWRGLSPFRYNPVYEYAVGLACDVLSDGERSPQTPYRVTGASAIAREEEQAGNGYLSWTVPLAGSRHQFQYCTQSHLQLDIDKRRRKALQREQANWGAPMSQKRSSSPCPLS